MPRPSAYVAYGGVITPDDYRAKDWCERCTVWASAAGGVGYLGRVAYDQLAPETGVGAVLQASVLGVRAHRSRPSPMRTTRARGMCRLARMGSRLVKVGNRPGRS